MVALAYFYDTLFIHDEELVIGGAGKNVWGVKFFIVSTAIKDLK